MCSKWELNRILQKMAETYQNVYGEALIKVLMYGSYARGDFDQDSDIDLVAIVRGERQQLQNKLKSVWDVSSELELEYETIVSPTVIPYDEYEQYREDVPYYRNIAREGVMIRA